MKQEHLIRLTQGQKAFPCSFDSDWDLIWGPVPPIKSINWCFFTFVFSFMFLSHTWSFDTIRCVVMRTFEWHIETIYPTKKKLTILGFAHLAGHSGFCSLLVDISHVCKKSSESHLSQLLCLFLDCQLDRSPFFYYATSESNWLDSIYCVLQYSGLTDAPFGLSSLVSYGGCW